MFDLFRKTVFTGLGLALKTWDEIEAMGKDWTKRQEMSEEEGRKFMDELRDRYDSSTQKFEEKVESVVGETLSRANIASRKDMEALEAANRKAQEEIAALRREIEILKTGKGGTAG
jgi:polyhydroxyalkanoate synthesis regulator phasin